MSVLKEKSAATSALHERSKVLPITQTPSTLQNNPGKIALDISTIEEVDSTHSSPCLRPQENLLDRRSSSFNSESKQKYPTAQNSFEGDLEAQKFAIQQSQATVSQTGLLNNKQTSDPMWPNRQELKRRRKASKRERACCACWAGLSKKQRSIISTMIILVVLGAGFGVGFGISKCVGGGIISSEGNNFPVLSR
ncbi:hypothetical protein K3495_g8809 [Podosphaera aphanis]|nr:hypothetical protein K3495_g8809 [Podosphaera aphanis]